MWLVFQVMTNGRYKSVEHWAMTDHFRARLCIGFFYASEFDAEIGPAQELIDQTHPCLFKNSIHEDYMKHYFSRGVEGEHSLYEYAGIKSSGNQRWKLDRTKLMILTD
jgi:isopenicillin N synthase-like dioxygenase